VCINIQPGTFYFLRFVGAALRDHRACSERRFPDVYAGWKGVKGFLMPYCATQAPENML